MSESSSEGNGNNTLAYVKQVITYRDNDWMVAVEDPKADSGWAVSVKQFISEQDATDFFVVNMRARAFPDGIFKHFVDHYLCDLFDEVLTADVLPRQLASMIFPSQGNCNFTKGTRAIKRSKYVNVDPDENPHVEFPESMPIEVLVDVSSEQNNNRVPFFRVLFHVGEDLPEATTTTAPETTTAPTTTVAPETTVTPTTTIAPETTSAPTTTMAPETTAAPTTTNAPETTTAPTTTMASETTAAPTTTIAPETTSTPTTTMAPETTVSPTTTIAPETTTAPTTTMAPETTVAPTTMTVEAPETTSYPTTTSAPTTTDAPETTILPRANIDPETSNPPEKTKAQRGYYCLNAQWNYYIIWRICTIFEFVESTIFVAARRVVLLF